MLRADSGSEHSAKRQRRRGMLVARAAREAINETERRLCGTGAVSRAAVAEGLALQGRRAATLLAPHTAGPDDGDTACTPAAWVHHRLGTGATSGFGFELAASTTQDGVDHCLVAHELALRIGAPGLCSFELSRAATLELVRLPDAGMIRDLGWGPADESDPGTAGDEAILAAADRAFEKVSAVTGRKIAAVTRHGAEGAEYALIASGGARASAERLARSLELQGVSCAVVCVHLVRPFPASALNRAVAGLKGILLLACGDDLADAMRRAVAGNGQAAPAVPHDAVEEDAVNAARRAFGLRAGRKKRARAAAAPALGLTARPAGDWAEGFLLDAATRIGTIADVELRGAGAVLHIGRRGMQPEPASPVDLALCAHPAYVEAGRLVPGMARGGTLVVVSSGPVPDGWWDGLRPATRASMLERELNLQWLDLGETPGLDLADPQAVREVLLDGFLAAGAQSLARALGRAPDGVPQAGPMRALDLQSLETARAGREPDFMPPARALPAMPGGPGEETAGSIWRDAARRFHLSGDGAHSACEPTLAEPLRPLVVEAFEEPTRQGSRYPVWLRTGEVEHEAAVAQPFEARVTSILDDFEAAGEPATILHRHLPRLSRAVGRALSRTGAAAGTEALLAAAADEFRSGFDVSDAGAQALDAELARVRTRLEALAPGFTLVGLDRTTLPRLHLAAVRSVRGPRRQTLLEEIDSLVQRLEDLLAIDDGHAPERLSAEALETSLDTGGLTFFDPRKLAENLPVHRGPVRLGDVRRRRIERTLETLRGARGDESDVDLVFVQPGFLPQTAELQGVRVVAHPRGLEAAIGLFDGLAENGVELFRALRVARLEVDGAYEAELHDAPLARFDWQGLTEDELLSLPRVVVLETDERLHGAGLGAWSELLRSGRPVQVLVAQSTSELRAAEPWQGLAGFHPGLGYVAVAHREAFVVESSLVCPERLVRGLLRMAGSLRPAAALVAVPAWDAPVPAWVQLLAAEQGRSVPCFSYDPEAGPHWAERFDLGGNPQPQRPWPVHTVRYADAQGREQTLDQPFTFAHAVALDPAYRRHFRIVPTAAWSAEQVELADYLAMPVGAAARKIPYVWVVADGNRLARALITRELAYASRDRVRAWRILQELAGTDNEYARRAAESARAEARANAEITGKALETEHSAELEGARRTAVREAMERLARALVGLDEAPASTLTALAEPTSALRTVTAEPAAAVEKDAVEVDAAEAVFVDPYIDSALCTSCQECININGRLFKYDANKQAYITDASNGTYEQLVKAAEKCPARCIHPGLPSAGDKTANDRLIARAAKFN